MSNWRTRVRVQPQLWAPGNPAGASRGDAARRVERVTPTSDSDDGAESTVVQKAIYLDGVRQTNPHSISAIIHRLAEPDKAVAWVGLAKASPAQIRQVGDIFALHRLAVDDAINAHQRPKLERYDDTLFVVLRPATYHDDTETVHLGEIHLFVGPDFVVTVRPTDEPELGPVRRRIDDDPHLMALGPDAVLYAVLDFVVDGYKPVLEGLEIDIDQIEEQVFESDPAVSRRIYELSREVLALQRATKPLLDILQALRRGYDKYDTDEELQRNLRDVEDHAVIVVERVDGFRQTLMSILSLNSTLVAQTQNEDMKRLAEVANNQADQVKAATSWAAILFTPTVIAGIYGMNFHAMPELNFRYGYPMAIGLMLLTVITMYTVFKKKNWL
ncbi:MAG: magnesium/cobalt transporter CorA [Allobranchiibius sp.]|nr:magnesium/cobalt transporter CorA [Actinomycetota bacterium]